MRAEVAPSGECLRADGRACLIVAVVHDWLLFNPCKIEQHVLTVINEDYY